MRLNNYLNEDVTIDSFNKLLPDYSEILKIYKKTNSHFLYRSSDHWVIFNAKAPRKERNPKNTVPKVHEFLDHTFYEKFGWRARSEGLFVSTSKNTSFYGENMYVIFPKNGFKYVYANDIMDVYNNIVAARSEDWEEYKKNLRNLVSIFTDNGLQNRLKEAKGIEVVLHCDEYYSLLDKPTYTGLFIQWLEDLKI